LIDYKINYLNYNHHHGLPQDKISCDVKIAAIRLYERNLLDLDDILDYCGFSERTFYRILKLWRETGDVINPAQSLQGRLRLLDQDDVQYVLRLVRQNPDYFQASTVSFYRQSVHTE